MIKKLTPVFVVILLFVALELLLAALNLILPLDAFVYRAGLHNSQFVYNREIGKPTQYLRDPNVFWRLKPGWFREGCYVNRYGFRGEDVSREKPKNTLRIICLGNSCTFGAFIDSLKDTYPRRIWMRLSAEYPHAGFEVINAGVNGYTTYQILKYWHLWVKGFNPDVITVYSGFNNFVCAPRGEDKNIRLSPLFCTISNQLLTFRVFRSLDATAKKLAALSTGGELETPYDEAQGILKRVSPTDYRKNLSLLTEDALARNIKVIFITTPSRREYPLCLIPRPRIIREGSRARVRWQVPDRVGAEWTELVDHSQQYETELQSALQRIERRPEMPASYFQAGYCYQHLGDSIRATECFANADSLDDDHHNLKLYNQIMREVAAQYRLPLADCEEAFSQENTVNLFVDDGIHPNEKGHALIADEVCKAIHALLGNEFTAKRLPGDE